MYQKILNLLKARQPGIWINSTEEKEVLIQLRNAVASTNEYEEIYIWSVTEGIKQINVEDNNFKLLNVDSMAGIGPLQKALQSSNDIGLEKSKVWVLRDYHQLISNSNAIRIIRDLKESVIEKYSPIIIIAPSSDIPLELQNTFKLVNHEPPTMEDIKELLLLWSKTKDLSLENDLDLLSKRLYGFMKSEIMTLLNLSYVENGEVSLTAINNKKIEAIKDSGLLDYKEPKANLDNIGGNNKFKEWIKTIEACMNEDARKYGIPEPKGYLSVGIPGTSKTFIAEALAGKWKVPFLRLQMNRINSKLVGETERNMAKALKLAESCSPCVLLIDEVEKALGGKLINRSSTAIM